MSDRGGDGEGEDEARQPICLDERGERINVREFLRVIVDDTDAEMAADRGGCAYYLRCQKVEGYEDGTCSFGCRDEPECITCEPAGGWPSSDPDYDYRAAWTDSFIGALFANALVHVDLGIPAPPSPLSLVWRRLADEWPEDEEWVWIARTNGRQPVWLGQVDGDSIVNGVAFLRRWNEELNGLRCWLPASVPAPPAAVPAPPREGAANEFVHESLPPVVTLERPRGLRYCHRCHGTFDAYEDDDGGLYGAPGQVCPRVLDGGPCEAVVPDVWRRGFSTHVSGCPFGVDGWLPPDLVCTCSGEVVGRPMPRPPAPAPEGETTA